MSHWPETDPYGRESAVFRGTSRTLPPQAPDIPREMKILAIAAVLGMVLASSVTYAIRTLSTPSPAAPAAAAVPDEPVERAETVRSSIVGPVTKALEGAAVLGDELAEEQRVAQAEAAKREAAERAAAQAAAEAAADEAADEDDEVVDLDDEDPADGDGVINLDEPGDFPPAYAGAPSTWSEIERHAGKRKKKRKKKKTKKTKKVAEASSAESEAPASGGGAFDRDGATSAMFAAAGSASGCGSAGGPSGKARVSVTLSPSGSVSSVSVSAPFAGTKVGSCIVGMFRSVSVAPFTGGAVGLNKSVFIGGKKKAKKKKRSSDEAEEASTADAPKKKRKKRKKKKRRKKKKKKKKRGRKRGRVNLD